MIKDIEKLGQLNLIKQNKIEYALSLLEHEAHALVKERSMLSSKIKSNYSSVYEQNDPDGNNWVTGLKQTFQNLDLWKTAQTRRIDMLTQKLNELDHQKEGLRKELTTSIVQDNIIASLQAKARRAALNAQIDQDSEQVLSLKTISDIRAVKAKP